MIQARTLSLSLGHKTLFDAISFTFDAQSKIGLVGNNGAGKTTLLKVIAGHQKLDSGQISTPKEFKLAYLPQYVTFSSNKSVIDEALEANSEAAQLRAKVLRFEAQLHNNHDDTELLEEYALASSKLLEHEDIGSLKAQAECMLTGLGFSHKQQQNPVAQLSEGWKMRLLLCKLLLQKADFYLFDEPTNHLDIVARQWFATFLKEAPFGSILVSHERYFLDYACTNIYELSRGNAVLYAGNFTAYEKEKLRHTALKKAAYTQQQKDLERKQKTIERFRASASKARQAQSMLKKLKATDRIKFDESVQRIAISFGQIPQPGKHVLTVQNLAFSFFQKPVFENVSFEIKRGERTAIIAPNGVGKSTLFKVLAGKLTQQEGRVTFGHNVTWSRFDQDQSNVLKAENTILEELLHTCPHVTTTKIRAMLGSMLFIGDDVHKKIQVLSGGEKNRVSMTRILLSGANTLLLDEPTNHLDIVSKDILAEALCTYPGTIVFVSHDRNFVQKIATNILELSRNGVTSHEGTYESFLYYKNQHETKAYQQPRSQPKHNKVIFENHKQLRSLGRSIEKYEATIGACEKKLESATYGTEQYANLVQKLQTAQKKLSVVTSSWEDLFEKMHPDT